MTFYRGGGSPGDLLPSTSESPLSPESSQQHSKRVSGVFLDAFIPARIKLYGRFGDYTPAQTTSSLVNLAKYLHACAGAGLSGSDILLTQCWPIAGPDRVRRWHAAIAAVLTIFIGTVVAVLRNGGDTPIGDQCSILILGSFPNLPRSFLVPGLMVIFILIGIPWLAWSDGYGSP